MQSTQPTFTIGIPTLNEEAQIAACIESCLSLNYPRELVEIIVIDNGSTDATLETLKKYDNVIIIREEKKGTNFARQAGLDVAKGDFYCSIDADTRVPKDWLTKAVRLFNKKEQRIGIAGPFDAHDADGIWNFLTYWIPMIYLRAANTGQCCNLITKTAESKKVGGFLYKDVKYFDDIILVTRLKEIGKFRFSTTLKASVSARRYKNILGLPGYLLTGLFNYFTFRYFGFFFRDRHEAVR